ncbi:MAG: hypothetical protein JWO37_578 [Acidimicrobiales bacterium]|jgi:hypothetical protein|nr:hypothetical protein [Acidimicrobiales bacterium]
MMSVEDEIRSAEVRLFENGRRVLSQTARSTRAKAPTLARWLTTELAATIEDAVPRGWEQVGDADGLPYPEFRREALAITYAAAKAAVEETYGPGSKTAAILTGATADYLTKRRVEGWHRRSADLKQRVGSYVTARICGESPTGPYLLVGYLFAAHCEKSTESLGADARDRLAVVGADIFLSTYIVTVVILESVALV